MTRKEALLWDVFVLCLLFAYSRTLNRFNAYKITNDHAKNISELISRDWFMDCCLNVFYTFVLYFCDLASSCFHFNIYWNIIFTANKWSDQQKACKQLQKVSHFLLLMKWIGGQVRPQATDATRHTWWLASMSASANTHQGNARSLAVDLEDDGRRVDTVPTSSGRISFLTF